MSDASSLVPEVSDEADKGSLNRIKLTVYVSLALGGLLLLLFEFLRGKNNRMCRCLYRQRHSLRFRKLNPRLKAVKLPKYPRGFLKWILPSIRISDDEFLEQVGLDGYMVIRFIRMCRRLCWCATVCGCGVLIPIYVTGPRYDSSDGGVFFMTMSNLEPGSKKLWATVFFAWVFSLYLLYTLRKEHYRFAQLRNDWLVNGDAGTERQAAYTILVERIPSNFRSPVMLAEFFDSLFPGQLHSATICLNLEDLNSLIAPRDAALQKLSKASNVILATGNDVMVRVGPGPCGMCGPKVSARDYYGQKVKELNDKLTPKLKEKLAAAALVENLKSEELAQLHESQENMAFFFTRQLTLADETKLSRARERKPRKDKKAKDKLKEAATAATSTGGSPGGGGSPHSNGNCDVFAASDGDEAFAGSVTPSAAPQSRDNSPSRRRSGTTRHSVMRGLQKTFRLGGGDQSPREASPEKIHSMQEAQALLRKPDVTAAYLKNELREADRHARHASRRLELARVVSRREGSFASSDAAAAGSTGGGSAPRNRRGSGSNSTALPLHRYSVDSTGAQSAAAAAATAQHAADQSMGNGDASVHRGARRRAQTETPPRAPRKTVMSMGTPPRGGSRGSGGSINVGSAAAGAGSSNDVTANGNGRGESLLMGSPAGWEDISTQTAGPRRHTLTGALPDQAAAATATANAAALAALSSSSRGAAPSVAAAAAGTRTSLPRPPAVATRAESAAGSGTASSGPSDIIQAVSDDYAAWRSRAYSSHRDGSDSDSSAGAGAAGLPAAAAAAAGSRLSSTQHRGRSSSPRSEDYARRSLARRPLSTGGAEALVATSPPRSRPLSMTRHSPPISPDGANTGEFGQMDVSTAVPMSSSSSMGANAGLHSHEHAPHAPHAHPPHIPLSRQNSLRRGREPRRTLDSNASSRSPPGGTGASPTSQSGGTPPALSLTTHNRHGGRHRGRSRSHDSTAHSPLSSKSEELLTMTPQQQQQQQRNSRLSREQLTAAGSAQSAAAVAAERHKRGGSEGGKGKAWTTANSSNSVSKSTATNSKGSFTARAGSFAVLPTSPGKLLLPAIEKVGDASRMAGQTVIKKAKGLGEGAMKGVLNVTEAVKILTVGSMSATGFVTFKTLAARASAVQALIAHQPGIFEVKAAPEPRDVIWSNVTRHVRQIRYRQMFVSTIVALGLVFWASVVFGIQALTSINSLDAIFPGLADYSKKHPLFGNVITTYLPVVALLVVIQNLYFIFKMLARRMEGYKTESEVERAVFSRYFYYQLANIYVTVTAGSIFKAVEAILRKPDTVLGLLGGALPLVAVYFTNLITVKVVGGLMMELCFGGRPLKFWRILCIELFTDPTLRTKEDRTRGVFEHSEPWYGRFFSDFLLVLMVVFIYQCIAPFIAAAGFLYFMLSELIYKYQLMHVYWPLYESGGLYFYILFKQVIIGAVAGLVTLIGYMSIRRGFEQGPFLLPLPVLVLYFGLQWVRDGVRASKLLSLDKAALQDREDELAEPRGDYATFEFFDERAYQQPSLYDEPDRIISTAQDEVDSDVDVDGYLQLDEWGEVVYPRTEPDAPSPLHRHMSSMDTLTPRFDLETGHSTTPNGTAAAAAAAPTEHRFPLFNGGMQHSSGFAEGYSTAAVTAGAGAAVGVTSSSHDSSNNSSSARRRSSNTGLSGLRNGGEARGPAAAAGYASSDNEDDVDEMRDQISSPRSSNTGGNNSGADQSPAPMTRGLGRRGSSSRNLEDGGGVGRNRGITRSLRRGEASPTKAPLLKRNSTSNSHDD